MAQLQFQDLTFKEEPNHIHVTFKTHFYFKLEKKELQKIADYNIINNNTIEFNCNEKKAKKQFSKIISDKITNNLKSNRGNKAFYIHNQPLIGSQRFGILDSDTSLIELRPITGCNLNCIYCSLNEGINCTKPDYYVDCDLLIRKTKRLVSKKQHPVTIRICAHGEPLLYPDMEKLIEELKKINNINYITLGTNGTLLTEKKIIQLKKAGLDQIGLSLNAFDQEEAQQIAGCHYDVERMKELAKIIAEHMDLIIAPIYLPGINDSQIEKLIQFTKDLNATIGIQNFLPYKGGRNPVKGIQMDIFFNIIEEWENKFKIKLKNPDIKFTFKKDKVLDKPFKKGDSIEIENTIGEYGIAKERLIKIPNIKKKKYTIVRDKHHIFHAK